MRKKRSTSKVSRRRPARKRKKSLGKVSRRKASGSTVCKAKLKKKISTIKSNMKALEKALGM